MLSNEKECSTRQQNIFTKTIPLGALVGVTLQILHSDDPTNKFIWNMGCTTYVNLPICNGNVHKLFQQPRGEGVWKIWQKLMRGEGVRP